MSKKNLIRFSLAPRDLNTFWDGEFGRIVAQHGFRRRVSFVGSSVIGCSTRNRFDDGPPSRTSLIKANTSRTHIPTVHLSCSPTRRRPSHCPCVYKSENMSADSSTATAVDDVIQHFGYIPTDGLSVTAAVLFGLLGAVLTYQTVRYKHYYMLWLPAAAFGEMIGYIFRYETTHNPTKANFILTTILILIMPKIGRAHV